MIKDRQSITVKESYQIWLIKIIAVFTIFFAHMPVSQLTLDMGEGYNWLVRLYDFLGIAGVPTFFFLSGYLYKKSSLLRRAQFLFIPLIILGSVTFTIHCLNHHLPLDFGSLFLWLIGSNCYLYFVPVLFWITLLYHICPKDWLWVGLGIASVLLSHYKLIPYTPTITVYMNPLNFIIYFAVGHLVRQHNLWNLIHNPVLLIGSILILSGSYIARVFTPVSYFHFWAIFVSFSFIVLFVYLTNFMTKIRPGLIAWGECTYVIYLIHMPIAGAINTILTPFLSGPFEFLKVVIAFLVVSGVVLLGRKTLDFIKFKPLSVSLGYR